MTCKYEKAELVRNKLEILSNFKGKSTVVSPTVNNLDVFSLIDDKDSVFINYLKVVKGAIIQGHTIELKRKMEEDVKELLLLGIAELRQRFQSDSKEIALPFRLDIEIPDCKLIVPQRGG